MVALCQITLITCLLYLLQNGWSLQVSCYRQTVKLRSQSTASEFDKLFIIQKRFVATFMCFLSWSPGVIFRRPFVKRFALCYRTVVLSCPVCHSVCLWRWCIVAKRLDRWRWNLACW